MEKTKSEIVIGNICHTEDKNWVQVSVDLTASQLNWNKKKLWFKFPKIFSAYVTNCYDPFLAGLLPLGMKTGSRMVIEGAISERLATNAHQIMEIFSDWYDAIELIEIDAMMTQPIQYTSNRVGSFFTCGVDSFYTVQKNLKRYHGEPKINHLLFVHGFDIDINNNELFNVVKNKIKIAALRFNLEPVFIQTNLRKITDKYVRWEQEQHGAALASAGLCLSKLFHSIYIPSSYRYSELHKVGSHPLIDPLWSNGSTRFIHDGNEANRVQKVLWQLRDSDIAMKTLRVCWKNPDNLYNCGKCIKCLRTKINLKLAGVLDTCVTLDNDIDLDKYSAFVQANPLEKYMLKGIIDSLNKSNTNNVLGEKLNFIYRSTQNRKNKMVKKFVKRLYGYF